MERNDGERPLVFVQMWLAPLEPGGEPEYEIVRGIADSTPYALPQAGAMLHVRRLQEGERSAVPDARSVYVHVVRGGVRLDSRRGAGRECRYGDGRGYGAGARRLGADHGRGGTGADGDRAGAAWEGIRRRRDREARHAAEVLLWEMSG